MLLLGGFALAAALSRHFIDKSLASFILSKVGTKPRWVLLTNMLVSPHSNLSEGVEMVWELHFSVWCLCIVHLMSKRWSILFVPSL